jgi:hypothetical protein
MEETFRQEVAFKMAQETREMDGWPGPWGGFAIAYHF